MADEAYRLRQGVATMADADLLLAVINGRLPEVITALDAGVSPDLSYSTGTTLIESACLNAFPFGDDASTLHHSNPSLLNPYIDKVIAAGGFRRYEQRHINTLAATFGPKLGLLPEMARVVVAFYAHCGFY